MLINLCEAYLNQSKFEANIAAIYEMINLPFTGNDSRALALCQDKFRTKAILKAFGLPVPRGELISTPDKKPNLCFPVIVKPSREDGSLGIRLIQLFLTRNLSK